MNILLVNPNDLYNRRYVILPNLGLGYTAASLEKAGHKVEIWDEFKENRSLDKFKTKIYGTKDSFDIVGFYFATPHYSAILHYSQIIKNIRNSIITVVGGPHIVIEPLSTLSQMDTIDFAIIGESEQAFPELIEAIRKKREFKDIHNLVWRKNGKVIVNERKFLEDLNKIPLPAWHLLKPDTYPLAPNTIFTKKKRIAPIVLTRGCPFECNFCAASRISGKKIRHRNPENAIEEIRLLKSEYNIEEIHIMDDGLTVERSYIQSFCEMLISQKIGIFWACPNGVRLDSLDKELIQLMERAGCYSISVGIESGVQRVLQLMNKHVTLEKIKEEIDLIKRNSLIRITGFFVMGYPGETLKEMHQTINFACNLQIDRANFFNFTPFPGTAVYKQIKFESPIIFDKLYLYSIPLTFGDFSSKELKKIIIKANMKFYSRFKIILGLLKEIKSIHQILAIIRRCRDLLRCS